MFYFFILKLNQILMLNELWVDSSIQLNLIELTFIEFNLI
jgi:hypothetical protein